MNDTIKRDTPKMFASGHVIECGERTPITLSLEEDGRIMAHTFNDGGVWFTGIECDYEDEGIAALKKGYNPQHFLDLKRIKS